ncbi:MAG: MFS transporter [Spirochaetaceae bacterium]
MIDSTRPPPKHPGSPERLRTVPFDPRRLPFFYGFVVLVFGTLGMVMSAPGQTIGVSVFTDHLIDELAIDRTLLSLAYLVGTVASALLLARSGRLYDRFGGRLVATAAATLLAAVLLGLTFAPQPARAMGGTAAAFILVTVGFFLLRYSGQGMLTLASRNMVMEWFDRRRGLANAVMGVSISFGFSYAPRFFDDLIRLGGWQTAWRGIAVAAAVFALLAFLFYRDTPEAHGMVPDGPLRAKKRENHPETATGRDFTLPEARRTYAFWVFAGSLIMAGLVITAYTFHIVSIFEAAGMDRQRAVGVFLPAAVVAVAVEFSGSWLSDYVRLKYLLMVQLVGLVALTTSIALLKPGLPVVGVIVSHGVMQGVFGILSNVTWPRFYGRAHLGAISGFVLALTVFGTAIGPYVFSLGRDVTGSYAAPALVCTAIALVLLGGATKANRPV